MNVLYRGSPDQYEPGELMEADGYLDRVYASSTTEIAWDVLTLNHDSGYVYEVEPTGACEPDDEYGPGESWWSGKPMVVIREVARHGV